jgi:hypothetical protein
MQHMDSAIKKDIVHAARKDPKIANRLGKFSVDIRERKRPHINPRGDDFGQDTSILGLNRIIDTKT